ncbi:VanZ family protein [Bacillus massiliigorillae]|uniref:VanZ family protein n=1 Tax=Bacillus massiliigorillae TaxID=1243664 RepID=UPI00039B784E|nr:VanZ family protein [Bacillus massiliigorillae]
MKKVSIYFVWLLPIAYMILVWVLSSLPANAVVELPDSKWDHIWKESMHLVEFAALYILFVIALATSGKLSLRTSLIVAIISASYGVVDEIHQSFYPYRSATLIDVVKDWIGVLAVWGHVRYHYFYKRKSILNKIQKEPS